MTANAYDPDRLREQIEILRREATQRSRLEREIDAEHEAEAKRARAEAEAALDATRKKYAAEIEATRREYATVRGRTKATAEAEQAKLDEQRKKLSAALARQAQQQEGKAREDDQFDEMQAREKHREDRKQPQRHHAKAEKELAQTLARLSAAEQEAARVLAACGLATPPPAIETEAAPGPAEQLPTGPEPQAALEALVTRATEQAHSVATLPAVRRAFGGPAKFAVIGGPLVLAVAAGLAAIFVGAPGGFAEAVATRGLVAGCAAAAVAAVGLGLGVWQLGRARARVRGEVAALRAGLDATIADARRHEPAVRGLLDARRDEQAARVEQRFAEQTEKRTTALADRIAAAHAQRDTGLADLEAKYTAATTSLKAKVAAANEATEQKYPPRLAALEKSAAEDLRAVEAQRDARLAAAADRRTSRWAEMTDRWRQVREETGAVYAEAARIDTAAFLPWDELARDDVPLPAEPPPGLRFGSLALNLEKVPGGVSAVPELNAFGPTSWRQPATVAYPVNASLLIKTTAEQKEVSSAMMQAMMLRIATGLPPGQSRFTIIDPLGLGKQFAGFMHLADHDELLVTSRIWTEPPLIEE